MKAMDVEDIDDKLSTMKGNILHFISLNEEAHFKSQQLNDPDLTADEKRQIAESILNKSPCQFLARFGRYLLEEHLEYFIAINNGDYELNYHLNELQKNFGKISNKAIVRNRRLEALRRLCLKGDYFSDEEMRKRDPLMYEQLVGQYLSKDEKEHLRQERNECKTFSGLLFDAIDEREVEGRLRLQTADEHKMMDEDDTDDTEEESTMDQTSLWGEYSSNKPKTSKTIKIRTFEEKEDVTEHEKLLMMNEFRSHVYSQFLDGKDKDIDYSQIDNNHDFDDLDMLEYDVQDKYFDSESPETVMKDDESNDSSKMDPHRPKSLADKMADLGK